MSVVLTVIAINTMLFLGLSVAKFAPWPEPVHPQMLRHHVKFHPFGDPDSHGEAVTRVSVRQWFLMALTTPVIRRRGSVKIRRHTAA